MLLGNHGVVSIEHPTTTKPEVVTRQLGYGGILLEFSFDRAISVTLSLSKHRILSLTLLINI